MARPHQGEVFLDQDFATAFNRLSGRGKIELQTDAGTQFSATASQTRDGRKVIRFFQHGLFRQNRLNSACFSFSVWDRSQQWQAYPLMMYAA